MTKSSTATKNSSRSALALAVVLATFGLAATEASAVSLRVKMACASDYYAHCSQHAVGSPGVRQCMRTNGPKLSRGCINALIDAGEVSKTEVARRSASLR